MVVSPIRTCGYVSIANTVDLTCATGNWLMSCASIKAVEEDIVGKSLLTRALSVKRNV